MNIENIKSIIEKHTAETTSRFGVYFKDLKTGESYGHGEEEAYPSASVFKVFVLAQLMKMVGEGKCTLADRIPMRNSDGSFGEDLMANISKEIFEEYTNRI